MAVIAVVTDLIFGTKITGTGKALGKPVLVARSVERLREQLAANLAGGDGVCLVIVDLNATGLDVMEAVRIAKAGGARVVAYLSHVQVELAKVAREAGADEVMARSAFVEKLAGMLEAA